MKKKRLRYSELAPAPRQGEPSRRVSTPVELARALAAERIAANTAPVDVVAPPPLPAPAAASAPLATDHADLLVFVVGHERFAIPLEDVDEAVDLPRVHFVPEMPASMLGVISLRGSLVPVYSPAMALGQALLAGRAVLILRAAPRRIGVLVDDVEDAIRITARELQELAAQGPDALVVGVLTRDQQLVSVMAAASLAAACREARGGSRVAATA